MTTQELPTYTFNKEKAIEVILYLLAKGGLDVYHLVKAILHADIYHLNKYSRPVVGDRYTKLDHGPVPISTYKIMENGEGKPFLRNGEQIAPTREPNTKKLSKSDMNALDYGYKYVIGRTFTDLEDEAHEMIAYKNTKKLKDTINYKDFIEPQKQSDIEEIFFESASIVF